MKTEDQIPTSRKSTESAKDKKGPRAAEKARDKVRNRVEKHKPRSTPETVDTGVGPDRERE